MVLLHYDADFDRIASDTGHTMEWVVASGSVYGWWTPVPGLTMFRRTLNGGALPKMSDSKTGPALPPPPGIDPDWREKIETAKRVREETQQARRGKPATFDMEGPPIRVGS